MGLSHCESGLGLLGPVTVLRFSGRLVAGADLGVSR